jgi:hypothetical protein
MNNFNINPEQYNNACYIVAGGPSLKDFDWNLLRGQFVIAINRSYEVLPDAQIVYFTDRDFWKVHKEAMLQHQGQLMRGALTPSKEENNLNVTMFTLSGASGLETEPEKLRHGSNSTYAATNLAAVHLGFKRIYLLGVDMKWGVKGNKKTSHWHDGHQRIDSETTYKNMIKNWETIVDPLKDINVEVWNANPDSALECFPKCTLERALANKPMRVGGAKL